MVGDIITDIFNSNIHQCDAPDYKSLLERVFSNDSKLESWKKELPFALRVRTRQEIVQGLVEQPDDFQLSAVLTLRYLNARTLLHRAVLAHLLDIERHNTVSASESAFLTSIENTSLEISVFSAVEMIEIHYAMSTSNQQMLTTWWFSLYYGEFSIQPLGP